MPVPKRGRPRGLVPGSRAEQLLAVARSLGRFSRELLAVHAWMADRARFGMPGYQNQFPDALLVSGFLCGLVRRGYVVREGKGCYRVARKGGSC